MVDHKDNGRSEPNAEQLLPSICHINLSSPEVNVLIKMEQFNRSNEGDARSATSRKSGSSDSARGGEPSPAPEDDDEDLWSVWSDVIRNWEHEIKKNPATIKVIQRDIPRTYPEMEFFKDGGRGQASLFNVIKAYSIHDKEVGYCQGSAFIVGLLLMQMPEEEAFAVIVRLMENYRLRELYKPAMTDLGLCMFQLECLVQEQGMEFIFCVAMSILQQARIDLLRLDMEGMLKYFQRDIRERYENDGDLLFAVANKVQLNPRKMRKWRCVWGFVNSAAVVEVGIEFVEEEKEEVFLWLEKDYLSKRTKEQEEAIELRIPKTALSAAWDDSNVKD
ncbi:TBC domain protein [Teladorsagia circumcincta]|uniref:TBC domain protein n=1 Tax=Teladorsagia circumcincta TaxID=45464 RepID=A0A2G9V146_TELCI|nr:TBC domain protein [Teladorsagia circumcincta]